ncbi:Periplasmic murein peptide-binding protein precursor [Listeria newyorkensis]|nr:Periplasmic murein peptide-binding protein precursor [Listeria newyorkensis]
MTIKLKSVPLKNRLALTTAGDYDVFYGTWTPDYSDPINFLEVYQSDGGLNFSKYNNATYDAGLNDVKQAYATDPEKRWDKMLELEKQLIQTDAVVAPFYQGASAYLLDPAVKNVQIYPFGRNISYRLAYVAK